MNQEQIDRINELARKSKVTERTTLISRKKTAQSRTSVKNTDSKQNINFIRKEHRKRLGV